MNPDALLVSLGLALTLDRPQPSSTRQIMACQVPFGTSTVVVLRDRSGNFQEVVTGDLVSDETVPDPSPDVPFERLQRDLEDYLGLRARGEPVEVVSVPGWLWFSYEQTLGQVQAVGQRRAIGRYNKRLRVVFVLTQAQHVVAHELVHRILHDNLSPPLSHDLNEGLVEAITMDFLGVETGGYPREVAVLREICNQYEIVPRDLPGLIAGAEGAVWRERLKAGTKERVSGWVETLSAATSWISFARPAFSFVASGALRLQAMPESAMFLRIAWLCHLGRVEEARAQAMSCLRHLDATFSAMVVASSFGPPVQVFPRTYDLVNLALSGEMSGMLSDFEPAHQRFYRAATTWSLHLSSPGA